VPAGVRGGGIGERTPRWVGGEGEALGASAEGGSAGANCVRGVSGEGNSVRWGLIGGRVRGAGRVGRVGRLGATNVASCSLSEEILVSAAAVSAANAFSS
jgi:hypothetical protein